MNGQCGAPPFPLPKLTPAPRHSFSISESPVRTPGPRQMTQGLATSCDRRRLRQPRRSKRPRTRSPGPINLMRCRSRSLAGLGRRLARDRAVLPELVAVMLTVEVRARAWLVDVAGQHRPEEGQVARGGRIAAAAGEDTRAAAVEGLHVAVHE